MIVINGVSKKYKDFYAVKNVSINLQQGEVYGLVGKNGAGKSTLFKAILGLTHVNGGSISINESTSASELNKAKRSIGFYMGPSFYPYLNGYDNLKYVSIMKGIKDSAEVDRVMKLVGLYGEKKKFKAYSLGMKQRLGIANALLGDPDIILLDEPINGLDPQGILEIRNIIGDLGKVHNKTVIVSSHILSELELVADRFGIIDHGILIKEFYKDDNGGVKRVNITTSNNDLSLELLKHLNPISKNQLIEVDGSYLTNDDLLKLINNDVQVYEITLHKENLEQQYFELTGGKN